MKPLLHLILPVLIFCSAVKVANAQYVTIPDTNFVNWLNNNGYSQCLVGNQLDTTCNAVLNAGTLICNNSNIHDLSGIQYFDNLLELGCDSNYLTSLPLLPNNLIHLYCSKNQITNINSFPNSLIWLFCDDNQLFSLPALPNTLGILHCSKNYLLNLPTLPNSLQWLMCFNNLLTSIPSLSTSLKYLFCQKNYLTYLPTLPSSLLTLRCDRNQIDTLPVLPPNLSSLQCDSNQIYYLPSLPPSIKSLSCSYNYLSTIAQLPISLQSLYCNNNQIASIAPLPNTLVLFNCSNNALSSLPDLPDSLNIFDCSNNSGLVCLPKLNSVANLNFSNTSISCLPNYGYVINSNPLLSTVPLCDLFNINGCESFWNISGKIYSDTNNNCIANISEPIIKNLKIQLFDSIGTLIQQTFSGGEGLFSFDTDTGAFKYEVDTSNLSILVSCPVSGFQISFLTTLDSMDYDMNFGMNCKPGFDVGVNAVVIDSGRFRPANFARIHFYAGDMTNKYGLHCAGGVSGTVQVVMSGNATYIGPAVNALTPTVNGDTLLYTIADFGNINFYTDFGIVMQTDTNAQAGNQICFDLTVTPTNGDNVAANNVLTHCFTVVNSYDPNEKSVYPAEIIDDKNGKLTYTIQFQNTGTAPAQHIYIMDTLDANLDVSSFELLAYSVQPVVQIIGNVARFNFPNMNLPDSNSNEPGSHGFVQFRIKLKDGLQLHTAISNTSYIYFDFNSPVQTNTVVDTLLDCDLIVSAFNISQTSFCKDDTLFANISLNDAATVNWYLDNVLVASDSIISIPNITLGNHTLKTEVITYYCTKEISTQIVFHDLPAINLGNDTAVCNSLLLDAGSGFPGYLWSDGSTTNSITISTTGNYSVQVTDTNGCVNSDVIIVVINPLPVISFNAFNQDTICITHGIQTINSGNPPGGLYSGDGVFGNTFDPNMAGIGMQYITYEFTDSLGCSNSSTDSVLVDYCLAIPVHSGIYSDAIKIYPNPALHTITIRWFAGTQTMDKLVLEIYDVFGRMLLAVKTPPLEGLGEADISDLQSGTYMLKVFEDGNLKSVNRFVKLSE